jgi:signal transduction histidine kinase
MSATAMHPDGPTRVPWAWPVWGVSMALTLINVPLTAATTTSWDVFGALFGIVAVGAFATVGALITSRQPGNRIGLVFSAEGLIAAVCLVNGSYAMIAFQRGLPMLGATAWISRATFPALFGPLAFLFLLYPTGQPLSARWRMVVRIVFAAFVVNVVLFAFTPGPLNVGFAELANNVMNPLALPLAWKRPIEVLTEVAGILVLVGAMLGVPALILRFRRADGVERQQIRWLLVLAAILGTLIVGFVIPAVTGLIDTEDSVLGNIFFFALLFGVFLGVPITCAVAILRYHLYDLDVVVKKAIVYGVLVVLLLVVAGAATFIVGSFVVPEDLAPSSLIAIGVAGGALVWPLRRVASRIADRLVFGGRTTAYEAVTTFAHRVSDVYASEDVLARMAALVAEATRAERATVWLLVGGSFRPAATMPSDDVDRASVGAAGDDLPALGADHAAPVRHQGELLGALAVTMPANDPIDRARERIVDDLAAQAGAVLRNVRLIEELRASRQRIVAAQDEERRKIERNLHDGAQQQLVALSVKQRMAATLLARDAERAGALLEEIQTDTTEALETLRDLARGIYPPLLADRGLAAALEAQSRKAAVPVRVEGDGVGRHAPEQEAAIYFCCLEALQNVAKYADAREAVVSLAESDGWLRFTVRDDGRGFDAAATTMGTGVQGMADRLDALGGKLEIRSEPGGGTEVAGEIPVG